MTVALALLLASTAVGRQAPCVLRRLSDPVVALVGWLTSIVAVVATSAVAMLLLPEHGLSALDALHHCRESVATGMRGI